MVQSSSYVIRIYRRGFSTLEGLIEDSGTGERKSFSKMEELWSILQGSGGPRRGLSTDSSDGTDGEGGKSGSPE